MPLPKPREILGYELNDVMGFDKKYMLSHIHENHNLGVDELRIYNNLVIIFDSKRKSKDNVIDMALLLKYCKDKGFCINELLCRRLINKYEYEITGKTYFIIKNGQEEWARVDLLRASKVQKGNARKIKRHAQLPEGNHNIGE